MDIVMLQKGDPCPCCGQPIKTSDPELLRLLTYIRDTKANAIACKRFMEIRGCQNGSSR